MFEWLGIVNPWLLAGALGVVSPILIHLLSKRRYKVLEWAAMDFLLQAERRNRRRIRLEHLLLLLLRCLIVMLIALLVARLFLQNDQVPSILGSASGTEHIVLIDDSPSMSQRVDNQTIFDQSTGSLANFFKNAAEQHPGDTVTLLCTSQPDRPLVAGALLDRRLDEIVRAVDQLEPADHAAHLDQALLALEQRIDRDDETGAGGLNRVVYIVTDLRRRDWASLEGQGADRSLVELLARLGEKSQGVVIVDVSQEQAENLTVASITAPDRTIVAGVRSRFEVTVINHGPSEVRDVKITFTAGNAPPQTGYIDLIAPGGAGAAPFSFTFADAGSVSVRAEVEPDVLAADNARDHVVNISEGVNVLIVDGDPSSEYGRSETFYLARAIDPPGDRDSGNLVEVVADNQFAGLALDNYQAVFLCNVYQVSPDQRATLRRWVESGGGLGIFLGDQVDPQLYNRQLGREGDNLLPVNLLRIDGDATERNWVTPNSVTETHPVLRIFAGVNNPFIERVKVFQWWRSEPIETDAEVTVISSLTDSDASPLMLERTVGLGRVLMLTTSVDGAWTSWPADESYPVTMLEAVRYLSRTTGSPQNLAVGQPLHWPLDVTRYRPEVMVHAPQTDEPTRVLAVAHQPDDLTEDGAPDASEGASGELFIDYEQTHRAGVYRVDLTRFDGTTEPLLLATHIDALEGNLAVADRPALQKSLENTNVTFLRGESLLIDTDGGSRAEMWRWLLVMLLITLAAEQTLAWMFGRRR